MTQRTNLLLRTMYVHEDPARNYQNILEKNQGPERCSHDCLGTHALKATK